MFEAATVQWFVSALNEVAVSPPLEGVSVSDCTLREGLQQPGPRPTDDERFRLADALDEAGVQEVEAGIPGYSDADLRFTTALAHRGLQAKVTAVCRSRREDVLAAAASGVWGALCSLPADPLQLKHKLGIGEGQAIERAVELTQLAHDQGLYVIFSPAYTTRADLGFLNRLIADVLVHGHVDRLRIVDSAGCAVPEAVTFLTKLLGTQARRPLEIHCHNDFGLAVANTLAAVVAGATVVSCSLTGIGPRAGNAALEEVVLALRLLYGVDTGVALNRLVPLARLAEHTFRVTQAPYKAVSGPNLMDLSSMASEGAVGHPPLTSQPYQPTLVGNPTPDA